MPTGYTPLRIGAELRGRERKLLFVFAAARAAIAAYPNDRLDSGALARTGTIHLLLAFLAFVSIFERLFYAAIIAWFFVVAARI